MYNAWYNLLYKINIYECKYYEIRREIVRYIFMILIIFYSILRFKLYNIHDHQLK